jgi:hypothetical protein
MADTQKTTAKTKVISMGFVKATQGTYVYRQDGHGEEVASPTMLGAIYVQKWTLGARPPQRLKITMEVEDDTAANA